jgi:hypothetical protein
LTEKNIEDLKHFFEFCIGSITPQNDDWEYQFDSIFLNDSKEKIKSKSEEQIKILEDISFLQIMSAFCEKIIFEAGGPSRPIKLNSKIRSNNSNSNNDNNNNNNNYSFYISSFHHHGKEITRKPYKFGKKIFKNLINRGESNKIIAKSYIFIKKKRDGSSSETIPNFIHGDSINIRMTFWIGRKIYTDLMLRGISQT